MSDRKAIEPPATGSRPTGQRAAATTLADEARFFWTQTNPRVIAPCLLGAAGTRVALGGWTAWDAVIVLAMIGLQPLTEWLIHVFILHWKPRRIFGRKIDPLLARKHREHHQDPRLVKWIFVPLPALLQVIPGATLLYILVFPTLRYALTATATALGLLLVYEWTHYLIHSRYKPRSRVYRYVWRAHRLHHFKNEKYWFGVTMHAADHVLGTFPERDAVETSPTCRTLGVEPSTL